MLDVTFDPEPRLRFQLVDIHGQVAREPLERAAAELRNGTSSWENKQRLS